jgi:putative membrane protein
MFVAYTPLALEEISNETADPFGTSPNDLALDAICRGIERSVLDACGEPLPPALMPDAEFVLT